MAIAGGFVCKGLDTWVEWPNIRSLVLANAYGRGVDKQWANATVRRGAGSVHVRPFWNSGHSRRGTCTRRSFDCSRSTGFRGAPTGGADSPHALLPRLALVAFVQSVGRCRLIARRSPTDESMAAVPEPIIVPTMTSPG